MIKPDFYIALGDYTPHDVWNMNRSEHIWPTKNMSDTFIKTYKYNTIGKMYPIIGNHESIPSDEFNIYTKDHQWILDALGDTWKDWFTEDCKFYKLFIARNLFKRIGCYSQLHPGSNLRIIGLFALAVDMMNPYLWNNMTNPWKIVIIKIT